MPAREPAQPDAASAQLQFVVVRPRALPHAAPAPAHPPVPSQPHYHYGYTGLDWPEEYATCGGAAQSPINVPAHTAFDLVPAGQESRFGYGKLLSDGSNIKLLNNGHTVQVVLPTSFAPNVTVAALGPPDSTKLADKFAAAAGAAVTRVAIKPVQLHWHVRSEHTVDGAGYPLEMHIVNTVAAPDLPGARRSPSFGGGRRRRGQPRRGGAHAPAPRAPPPRACCRAAPRRAGCGAACYAVVGVMFTVVDDDDDTPPNPFLDLVFANMPLIENVCRLARLPAAQP